MQRYLLEIIVFICGAVVMVLELVGSRLMAPYVGTSIYVWASLIGVILGSLSLGYWWGGKLADMWPQAKSFSLVIFVAAIIVWIIPFIKQPVLNNVAQFADIRMGAVMGALVLFAPASVLLGMISPYAVKLKMHSMESSGATVGQLYAISTLGSIFGTFLAGFYLIARFGSTNIIFILAVTLLVTSFFAFSGAFLKSKLAIFFLILGSLQFFQFIAESKEKAGFIEADTQYNHITIFESKDKRTNRAIRVIATNPREMQSAMYLDGGTDLVFQYTNYYLLASHFKPDLKKALIIGGGAYSFPKEFLRRYPSASIDVVEIDPKFTSLAKEYFGLKEDERMRIFHEDGRIFLNKTKEKYGAIYMDAFNSHFSMPFHLSTKEALIKAKDSLEDDGVVLANVVSALDGERGKFLRGELATYKEVFPQVYLFKVVKSAHSRQIQNLVILALKTKKEPTWMSDDAAINELLGQVWKEKIDEDIPILTDEFAPVEQYIKEMI